MITSAIQYKKNTLRYNTMQTSYFTQKVNNEQRKAVIILNEAISTIDKQKRIEARLKTRTYTEKGFFVTIILRLLTPAIIII